MKYCLLFLMGVALISCGDYHPRDQEVKQWKKFYDEYGIKEGAFEILDNSHELVYYYNLDRVSRRMCPASTFKIMNSLIALETGIAPDENLLIKYDGKPSWNPSWNKDMTMAEAFKVSNLKYYQELARRIGRPTMQSFLDSNNYGNQKIGAQIDQFWIDGSLLISPDEQVGFMKQLYFDNLSFSKRTMRIVKKMMIQEDSLQRLDGIPYRLSYKTGTSVLDSGYYNCWVVGYVEDSVNNAHPYFFASNMMISDTTSLEQLMKIRLDITKNILRERGLM